MLKHYVEYMMPGVFMSESSSEQVPSRSLDHVLPVKDESVFGFRFFDREETESNGETLKGKKKNYSGMYYFGKKMSAKDVEAEVENPRTLLSNMRINDWEYVVQTKLGNFQPLEKNDIIIG